MAKNLDGAIDIGTAMHAAGGDQFCVHKGLCAETDPVDSRGQPVNGLFDLDGFGIGFEGNFFEGAGKSVLQRLEHVGQKSGLQKTRRAAADVHRIHKIKRRTFPAERLPIETLGPVHARVHKQVMMAADFPADGLCVRRKTARGDNACMEITVGALGLAERDLDIYTPSLAIGKNITTSGRGCRMMRTGADVGVDDLADMGSSGAGPLRDLPQGWHESPPLRLGFGGLREVWDGADRCGLQGRQLQLLREESDAVAARFRV